MTRRRSWGIAFKKSPSVGLIFLLPPLAGTLKTVARTLGIFRFFLVLFYLFAS
jgi:hypothetical protein